MKFASIVAVAALLAGPRAPVTRSAAPALAASSFHYDGVLGTSADFTFVSLSKSDATRAERVALAEIERLRLELSSWDDRSELSQLFAQGSLEHPSAELLDVLNRYSAWNARSGHAYSA